MHVEFIDGDLEQAKNEVFDRFVWKKWRRAINIGRIMGLLLSLLIFWVMWYILSRDVYLLVIMLSILFLLVFACIMDGDSQLKNKYKMKFLEELEKHREYSSSYCEFEDTELKFEKLPQCPYDQIDKYMITDTTVMIIFNKLIHFFAWEQINPEQREDLRSLLQDKLQKYKNKKVS